MGAPATAARWRVTGVPVVLAAVVLVIAAALLLGVSRGTDGEAALLPPGPLGSAAPSPAPSTGLDNGASSGGVLASGAPASSGAPAASSAPGAPPPSVPEVVTGPVLVHVDGAVQRPGVVTVPAGSRAADAVAAAGGPTDDADTRLVNLARPVTDGELLVVPRDGEPPVSGGGPGAPAPPGTGGAPAAGDVAGPGGSPGVSGTGLIDLNTADEATFDTLPGIGPVLATRIVEHRTTVGPFMSVDDLTSVTGIGPAVLADVRDLVTV